jgi:serine/threonine-protein kinase
MHVSERDLQAVLSGEPTDSSLEQIEVHIENCARCRDRLEGQAAEAEWRRHMQQVFSDSRYSQLTRDIDLLAMQSPTGGSEPRTGEFDTAIVWKEIQGVVAPPKHPEMMGRIGRYDIERIIGRGGMGIVIKAFDPELNRPVAIKIMSPALASHGTARQRFAREARAAAAVLHPNVIPIHGVDNSFDVPYLVMQYVAGESLQELVDSRGPVDEKDILRIVKQIASGLSAAHAQGLVHRDIKPANILIDNDVNRALITDFGLARAEDDVAMTRTGWIAGSLNFMSPEQASGRNVDLRSDLFSLGGVTYFLATGRLPFRSETAIGVLHRIKNDQPSPIRQLNAEISPTLSQIVERLMEKDPSDRFQSAAELELVLEQYLAYLQQPAANRKPPRIGSPAQRRNRDRALIRVAGAALTLVGIIAFVVWGATQLWSPSHADSGRQPATSRSTLTWEDIANKYGLVPQDEFDSGMAAAAEMAERLRQELDASESWATVDGFETNLGQIRSRMIWIESSFDDPPIPPNSANK